MNDDDHRCFSPGCVVADFTLSKSSLSLPHQCRPAKHSQTTAIIPNKYLSKGHNLVNIWHSELNIAEADGATLF
ncbi:MAG: hypothetical protein K9N47_03625 [Prosthecobacter sp.]|nr:hypothetical protein [Prosthecobacter sp.]